MNIRGDLPIEQLKLLARLSKAATKEQGNRPVAGARYCAAAEAIRDFNFNIEMAQTNAMASLEFAQEVGTAKGVAEAAALSSSHIRKQFETLRSNREIWPVWRRESQFHRPLRSDIITQRHL